MKDKLREIIDECLETCTEYDLQTICKTLEKIGFDTNKKLPPECVCRHHRGRINKIRRDAEQYNL